MHRTTLSLEAPVEKELRRLAAKEKRSLKELVNDLIKRGLKTYQSTVRKKIPFEWHSSDSAPISSFDPANRSTYLDLLDKNIL